jgi:hypothetical protein
MSEPCDYSRPRLPNDPSYVQLAVPYVRAAAVRMGFVREELGTSSSLLKKLSPTW